MTGSHAEPPRKTAVVPAEVPRSEGSASEKVEELTGDPPAARTPGFASRGEVGRAQHPAFSESFECCSGRRAADVEECDRRVHIEGRVCEHLIDQPTSSSIGPE